MIVSSDSDHGIRNDPLQLVSTREVYIVVGRCSGTMCGLGLIVGLRRRLIDVDLPSSNNPVTVAVRASCRDSGWSCEQTPACSLRGSVALGLGVALHCFVSSTHVQLPINQGLSTWRFSLNAGTSEPPTAYSSQHACVSGKIKESMMADFSALCAMTNYRAVPRATNLGSAAGI
jgi:hypothetical protein